ncbi:MAG TPA: bifunctional ornithine acetyltransferase/N-acetylglutamate synthase, partial [Clostridia bacterium]|nr:bifunctional ornithine acetyltransferase/N-acetylglutamate synthase [Clostridia bacterium]
GIAKGSGMIHPNMATLLVFLTTDVNISANLLEEAITEDVKNSFNMVSVDGDTSTNDMLSIMANGMANNIIINEKDENYLTFTKALNCVTTKLCKLIAKDGEGATKLIECKVIEAIDNINAKIIAKSVITSSLFKAAMFGADANWGRVLCAIGYSKADVDINKIDVSFSSSKGTVDVCKNGSGIDFSEEIAKKVLLEDEISVLINCNSGSGEACAWGCDLTYDYVKINGDYRT